MKSPDYITVSVGCEGRCEVVRGSDADLQSA